MSVSQEGIVSEQHSLQIETTQDCRSGTDLATPSLEVPDPLPRHDDFSLARQSFSVVSILLATTLLLWNFVRIVATETLGTWWTPLAALAGMFAADFTSGLIHWAADTWGSVTIPVIGRRLLHPFRVHHVNPDDFLRRRFIDTNGDVAFIAIPVLIGVLALPATDGIERLAAIFMTAFCAIGLFTNQVHQWAHMTRPPLIVRILQDSGLILSREAHWRHHIQPYAGNYCIATGWCNHLLTSIEFFRRLERCVSAVTGLVPRHDDQVFTSTVGIDLSRPIAGRARDD